jgi:hypothetical protein
VKAVLSWLIVGSLLLVSTSLSSATSKDGPRRWTKVLKKKTTVEYKIAYVAGKDPAEFAVIGDGGTDVDIYVTDSKGNAVAKDTNNSDLALVRWPVTFSQTYTIRVVNLGDEDNECLMGHN